MQFQLLLIILVAFKLVSCLPNKTPKVTMCSFPPPEEEIQEWNRKIMFPKEYKISGSVTDWNGKATWIVTETRTKDFRVVERTSNRNEEKWIEDLSNGDQKYINSTEGTCDGRARKANLFGRSSEFKEIIGSDTSSMTSIINSISLLKPFGFIVKDRVEVIGGIDSKVWISCLNGSDSKYVLEIRFSDEESVSGVSAILSIRIAELKSFESTVSINHWSMEVDRLETPKGDEAVVNDGVFCSHDKSSFLQLKPLDEYAAVLHYRNHKEKTSQSTEILYSKSRELFIVSGESPMNVLNGMYLPRIDYILHDFKHGYEMTMSQGACEQLFPLPENTRDTIVQSPGYVLQSPMEYILIPSFLTWNKYGIGEEYVEYRSQDFVNNVIWQLRLTPDMEIISYKMFDSDSIRLLFSLEIQRIQVEKSKLNISPTQLSSCYDDGQMGNNTWIVPIRNKILNDMNRVGLKRVNDAVVKSINETIHRVIPYRIVVFYVENEMNQLSLIIRIIEKTVTEPAMTHGYDYTNELPANELFGLIYSEIYVGNMTFEVENIDGDTESWIPESMTRFPHSTKVTILTSSYRVISPFDFKTILLLIVPSLFFGFSIGGAIVYFFIRRSKKGILFSNINLSLPTKC
uniref:F-box domain-containing protein n=1 Tax=Caenorhabditis tropicalis TaxID=1561998 RepID=A0A1I7UEM3_9PELO